MAWNGKSGKTGGNKNRGNQGGRNAARGGRGNRGAAPTAQHPGEVLAEILDDTPVPVAAKWFSITPEALLAVLEGRAPMTQEMATVAGAVFGTGSAPWIEMQRLYDEALAKEAERQAAKQAARAAQAAAKAGN